MHPDHNLLSVFEHQTLKASKEGQFQPRHLEALQRFYGENGTPFFSLVHNGVKFCEQVGVIQVGELTLQVLPKIDRVSDNSETWHSVLIDMLKAVGAFKVAAPTTSNLRIKSNSILELYIELFVVECEYLLHHGLVKKYRQKEGNLKSLKGTLLFSKNIKHNLIHQERLYTTHTTYDTQHVLNAILYKTLCLLRHINTSSALKSRIAKLLLYFPEQKDVKVGEALFARVVFNRKTITYRNAIEIAKLLLLNYHPDVVRGQNHVLALMFDMNQLWERYVYRTLSRMSNGRYKVTAQANRVFWESAKSYSQRIKPDLIIEIGDEVIVLDTKWKTPESFRPADSDLKQMFAYNHRFKAKHSMLLYPGAGKEIEHNSGSFFEADGTACSMLFIPIVERKKLTNASFEQLIDRILENHS